MELEVRRAYGFLGPLTSARLVKQQRHHRPRAASARWKLETHRDRMEALNARLRALPPPPTTHHHDLHHCPTEIG